MMENLAALSRDKSSVGRVFSSDGKSYKVAIMDDFSYTDPVDQSFTSNQVIVFFHVFIENSRLFHRKYKSHIKI